MTVLYVMSHGWSGSTILGNILGELDGAVHVGELRALWADGLLGEGRCGCGRLLRACEFWAAVLDTAFGSGPRRTVAPAAVADWHAEAARVRNTIRLLCLHSAEGSTWPALERYAAVAAGLYRAVGEVARAWIVVDTSKRAGDAALVRLVPGLRVRYVHLVRDPRAVAHSWHKRREPGHGPVATMRDWVSFNLLFEAIRRRHGRGRSVRVRYEDLVARPRQTLDRIAAMIGPPGPRLPLADDRTVLLGPNHTVLGNPVRFDTGEVRLRDEEPWRTDLPARDRRIVTALAAPLMLRYGYALRGAPGGRRGS